MLTLANNNFITKTGIGMDAGEAVSKILANAKDFMDLIVLAILGTTAIAWRHGKQIFGSLLKPKQSVMEMLVRRITVLEEKDLECSRNMAKVQGEVAAARNDAAAATTAAAESQSHSESCAVENTKLKDRVKMLEGLILKRHGVEETE